jgi:iron(III) transport system permease protein
VRTALNRFRLTLTPQRILSIVFLVVLGYLVIVPLFLMLRETFIVHPLERFQIPGSQVGETTWAHWQRTFVGENSVAFFYRPLWNTLRIAFGLSILALVIGGTLAWLVVRTDLPWKNVISNAAIIPYVMPSWTLALAWLTLFKNQRIGGDQGIFTALTGLSTPDWFAYGLFPITITLALHYFPFGFMLIGGALRNIDAQLEESAELLGASRATILRRVVVPLVLPAIFSTFLLTFSRGLGTFGTPAFLGGPVREFVLSTTLYANLIGQRPGIGYLAAFVMILLGVLVLYMDHKIIGARRSYVTISGKGARAGLVALGRWRWPIAVGVMGFIVAVIAVPIVALAIDTVMLRPGIYAWSNFSWHYWIGEASLSIGLGTGEAGILRNSQLMGALGNTLRLALVVALITGVLGMLVGYAIVRLRGTWVAQALDQMSFLPYLMPSIALGSIFLALFAVPRGPIPSLYGSFWLLVIACSVSYLPYAVKAGVNAMRQVGPELEEAAIMTGASWWTRMRRVLFPVQKATYFSGMLLPFISVTRELSLLILLVTPATQLAATITLRYTDRGWYPYTNGMVLLLVIIVISSTAISRKLMKTDLAKGLGG